MEILFKKPKGFKPNPDIYFKDKSREEIKDYLKLNNWDIKLNNLLTERAKEKGNLKKLKSLAKTLETLKLWRAKGLEALKALTGSTN